MDRTRFKQTPESSYVDGGAGGVVVRALVLKRVGGEDGRAHGGAVGLARPVCEIGGQAAQDRALRWAGLVAAHEDHLSTTRYHCHLQKNATPDGSDSVTAQLT